MATAVPSAPQPQELAAHLVASPVSAAACAQVWAAQVAFLTGRAVHSICSVAPHEVTATGTALTVPVQWWPSPGCRLALVTVDLHGSQYANVIGRIVGVRKRATVTVTVPSGAGNVSGSTLFDGSETLAQREPLTAMRTIYTGFVHLGDWGDVKDEINDVAVTIDDVGGDQHQGLAAVTLTEIPVATLRPESGEHGLALATFDPRNDINDGDSLVGSGATEILTAEQRASTRVRWHWQVATYEDTTYAWTRSSSTTGAIDWVGSVGTAVDPKFRLRVPAVYGTSASTPATFTLRVRYRSTKGGTFRVVRTTVGGGATSNNDLALPGSGGAWTTASGTLTLRADGTDQEIDLQFNASTVDASTLYISSIAIIQTETP